MLSPKLNTVVFMLIHRKLGIDLTKEVNVERWYHISTMSLNPYLPFLREMYFVAFHNDEIILRVAPM